LNLNLKNTAKMSPVLIIQSDNIFIVRTRQESILEKIFYFISSFSWILFSSIRISITFPYFQIGLKTKLSPKLTLSSRNLFRQTFVYWLKLVQLHPVFPQWQSIIWNLQIFCKVSNTLLI